MLPPFIIEQIRRREEEERRREREQQPVLELPIPVPGSPSEPRTDESEADRGVVVIDLIG